ncbi:MAG: hypothetical protein JSR46_03020, partial [Verrucomicrobia bacterium]|nr:hypothetical protein [Verrucomicrobiota bacterium]
TKTMSLPVRHQPFQSPNDYAESQAEQKAFVDMAFMTPRAGLVRWFWDRFSGDQVSNKVTRARKDQPPQLSQFFDYNGMNIVDGGFSFKESKPCCKSCASPPSPLSPYTKPPYSCMLANPQAEGAKCPPWHGIPTKEYLYNDMYLCCASNPFGASPGQLLNNAKKQTQSFLTVNDLNHNLDEAYMSQYSKTQSKVKHLMSPPNHLVSTRISTS